MDFICDARRPIRLAPGGERHGRRSRRHRGAEPADRRPPPEPSAVRRHGRPRRPAQPGRCVPRDGAEPRRRPVAADRRADALVGRPSEAVAAGCAALRRRGAARAGRRAGRRAWCRRPALSRSGLDRELVLRSSQAVLPAHRRLHSVGCGGRARPRREGCPKTRLLHAPIRRCPGADQLSRHQSGGAERDRRDEGRERRAGLAQPARRPRSQRRPLRAPHVGREPLHPGRDHRRDSGKGGLPERPHAADPVCAGDGDGVPPAAPHRAALDQQVLRARPEAEELLRALGGLEGLHGLHDLLGQPGRAAHGQDLRGLHGGGPARGARCDERRRRASARRR